MIIKSLRITNNRNYINRQPLSHFVWNHYNPNNRYKEGMIIHHIDGDTLNDHISNLQMISRGDHNTIHSTNRKHSNKSKILMSISRRKVKSKPLSKETKEKMSLAKKGKSLSYEHKIKISESLKGNKHTLGFKPTEETKKKLSEFRKRWWKERKEKVICN
jgi:hypothetical protein